MLIWVNMARLPYLQMKPPENAIHAVTVTAEHDGVLCIHDCYAPLGLYSDKVATHVMEVPFSDYRLENDPRFLKRIERARNSLQAGRGVRLEDVKSE